MKKTTNIITLIGNFLGTEKIALKENILNEKHGFHVQDDEVTFDFASMHIDFRSCQHIAPQEELDFLYNLLDLHLKSVEALDQNCLSSVSNHELKNILSSAQLSLEMLNTYDFDKDDRTKLLSQAFNAVSQSVSLFNEMLLIEKLQHQQQSNSIDIEMIHVRPIVESILETLYSEITAKSIEVEVVDEGEDVAIHASAFWIERALFNLISNAVKYNTEHGFLRITFTSDKKRLRVSVADSGIGIKESEQDKVMQKFETSDATQKQGTGIGLALVQAVVDAHKGTLEFDSVYGEGTNFIMILPRKLNANRIQHPMAVMNAALVLMMVGVSYLFPVIPSFNNIETADNFDLIKLEHGSTIKIDKGAQYSFWDLHNITGSKVYRHLDLQKGKAEADLHEVHVAFATPTSSFTNLGTELAFEQKPDKGVVSVYKGELEAGLQHVYEGEGFVSSSSGISVVELLDPPYGLGAESGDDGVLMVSFTTVQGAEKYRVTLAEDEEFMQVIALKEASATELRFKVEKDGFYYVKAVALDKNGILGLPNTAVVTNRYHLQQGIAARDRGAYAQAEKLLKQSITEFKQRNAEPYSELAWNYYLQKDYTRAVRYFQKALALRETEGEGVRLARTFYHLKEYDKANVIYQKMLQENGNNVDALWGTAEIMIVQNDYINAKRKLQKLLHLNPKYPLANYDMARVMFLMKNRNKGLQYLKKELKNNPDAKDLVDDLRMQVLKER